MIRLQFIAPIEIVDGKECIRLAPNEYVTIDALMSAENKKHFKFWHDDKFLGMKEKGGDANEYPS